MSGLHVLMNRSIPFMGVAAQTIVVVADLAARA